MGPESHPTPSRLELVGIEVSLGGTPVVADASLVVEPGTCVGILGPNGSGKTTLLRRCLGALSGPGRVLIDDIDADQLRWSKRARLISAVDQHTTFTSGLTVWESVMLGRIPHVRSWQAYSRTDTSLAENALARTGTLHLKDRPMLGISGGERQRVAIARALVQNTGLILLDEPTNHLDMKYQHQIMALVVSLPATTVVVCHDANLALAYCDSVIVMDRGRIIAQGPAAQTLTTDLVSELYGVRARTVTEFGQPHLVFARVPEPSRNAARSDDTMGR